MPDPDDLIAQDSGGSQLPKARRRVREFDEGWIADAELDFSQLVEPDEGGRRRIRFAAFAKWFRSFEGLTPDFAGISNYEPQVTSGDSAAQRGGPPGEPSALRA